MKESKEDKTKRDLETWKDYRENYGWPVQH